MENYNAIVEAANNGDAVSQYKLARAYEMGDGVTKDLKLAREWYQKSADNGYKNAEVKLRLLPVQESVTDKEKEEPAEKRTYQAPPAPAAAGTVNTKQCSNNVNANMDAQKASYPQKSKVVAALLALFLGSFGVHDFYLGYNKNGIIKIILTITGIGAIVSYVWTLFDLIKILCNGKFDSNGQALV